MAPPASISQATATIAEPVREVVAPEHVHSEPVSAQAGKPCVVEAVSRWPPTITIVDNAPVFAVVDKRVVEVFVVARWAKHSVVGNVFRPPLTISIVDCAGVNAPQGNNVSLERADPFSLAK